MDLHTPNFPDCTFRFYATSYILLLRCFSFKACFFLCQPCQSDIIMLFLVSRKLLVPCWHGGAPPETSTAMVPVPEDGRCIFPGRCFCCVNPSPWGFLKRPQYSDQKMKHIEAEPTSLGELVVGKVNHVGSLRCYIDWIVFVAVFEAIREQIHVLPWWMIGCLVRVRFLRHVI